MFVRMECECAQAMCWNKIRQQIFGARAPEPSVPASLQSGGTLNHFHVASLPVRSRFWGDAHGKRGRKPQRPKGEASIRHAFV